MKPFFNGPFLNQIPSQPPLIDKIRQKQVPKKKKKKDGSENYLATGHYFYRLHFSKMIYMN